MSESCMHEISPLSYVIKMRLHVRFRSAFCDCTGPQNDSELKVALQRTYMGLGKLRESKSAF